MASKKVDAKKRAQDRHAKESFMERYNINLTDQLHIQLVKQIQTGQAFHLKPQSHRINIFRLIIEGKRVPVVYDSSRKQIVTALPDECNDPAKIGVFDERSIA